MGFGTFAGHMHQLQWNETCRILSGHRWPPTSVFAGASGMRAMHPAFGALCDAAEEPQVQWRVAPMQVTCRQPGPMHACMQLPCMQSAPMQADTAWS